jgi:phage terminase small subunit
MGCENLTKPHLREHINIRLEELSTQRIMKADEVMVMLTSIARNEEKEEVVVFGDKGPELAQKGMSAKDRLKALELIGKRYTLWTDKQQIEGNLGVTIVDDIDD